MLRDEEEEVSKVGKAVEKAPEAVLILRVTHYSQQAAERVARPSHIRIECRSPFVTKNVHMCNRSLFRNIK